METLHPGIYLQEVAGENPIDGVSTSTGAFVGVTERGYIGKSVLVTSWKDFQKQFGGYVENSYLPYAVRGFFENGGTRAFISRAVKFTNLDGVLTKSSAPATVELQGDLAGTPKVFALIDAKTDGVWGARLSVEVKEGKEADTYSTYVYEGGTLVESFEDLAKADLEDVINNGSSYITLVIVDEETEIVSGTYKLVGGSDGLEDITSTDYIGDEALGTGLYAFENDAINLVAIPGITDASTHAGITQYVEKRSDCTAIIETPLNMKPSEAIKYLNTTANIYSARVNAYFSWIQVSDPIGVGKNPTKFIPPSGHLMGIYARIDNARGVWKAPAGLEAVVQGAIGLEYNVNDNEQDLLNPEGINAIRAFDGEGIVVWGARTRSKDIQWKYTPVRRSADFVGQSILAGTRWAVFEPNDQTLWDKVSSVVSAFLRGYWRAGGLRGNSEAEAFFVECNSATTTADDIDAGRLYCNVGICPQKPAEFIIFRLSLLK